MKHGNKIRLGIRPPVATFDPVVGHKDFYLTLMLVETPRYTFCIPGSEK